MSDPTPVKSTDMNTCDRPTDQAWKPIAGFEGLYDIGSRGATWSRPRKNRPGRLLKQCPDRDGYLRVEIFRDGRGRMARVHLLVLAAFAGPRPEGFETRHLDGDRTNNSWPENLAYGTRLENAADKVQHGTDRGGRVGPKGLTCKEVREIHRAVHCGEAKRAIARRFDIDPKTVRQIVSGEIWPEALLRKREAVSS